MPILTKQELIESLRSHYPAIDFEREITAIKLLFLAGQQDIIDKANRRSNIISPANKETTDAALGRGIKITRATASPETLGIDLGGLLDDL